MTENEIIAMREENFALKEKVFNICKVYTFLRPVLKFARVFAFIKKGWKTAIDAALIVLDEACEIK